MDKLLDKVSELIDKSSSIPGDIKNIVKAICRGYIRESKGRIPISGIMNVCKTKFIEIDSNDKDFAGEEKHLGETKTDYDKECNVLHEMSYVKDSNYVKLISILVHELGHVITEPKPNIILDDGTYPLVKRTSTYYVNVGYVDDELCAVNWRGFKMSDGFLEHISARIFESEEFRDELSNFGYDLGDYVYKDERLFPSRIYDEFRACFELFDYIMDGNLFDFSCRTFKSNEEMSEYINENKFNVIFGYIDKSNDALWKLKPYEGKEWNEKFDKLLKEYLSYKDTVINLSHVLLDMYGKNDEDSRYKELLEKYVNTINLQRELPIPEGYLKKDEMPNL